MYDIKIANIRLLQFISTHISLMEAEDYPIRISILDILSSGYF